MNSPQKEVYRPLTWNTPVGWERLSGPNGLSLYVSPQSDERAWGVRVRKTPRPQPITSILSDWEERLGNLGAKPTGTVSTSQKHGTTLTTQEYVQGNKGSTSIYITVGVQGLHVYEELWQVSTSNVNRLAPLANRLKETVLWNPPSSYMDAKREFNLRSRNYKVKARYAMAQLEWGQAENAIVLFDEMVKEEPKRPMGWSGLIHAAHWYPTSSKTLSQLAETIFKNHEKRKKIASAKSTNKSD